MLDPTLPHSSAIDKDADLSGKWQNTLNVEEASYIKLKKGILKAPLAFHYDFL